MKKVAVLYDFDKTLCTKDMQEYSLIPSLGYEEPGSFWREVSQLSVSQQMDSISAYLYWLQKKYSDHDFVVITTMGIMMLANNYFNEIAEVDLPEHQF